MLSSVLFLNEVTSIDHAYIDAEGMIVGGSLEPKFQIGGEVDEAESVVIDFSNIKKMLKQITDDKEEGWDHKLWWIDGYSKGLCFEDENGMYVIKTPSLKFTVPKNAVKIMQLTGENQYTSFEADYKATLETKLSAHYGKKIVVSVLAATDIRLPPFINCWATFRYTHGLKNSSSWGCQNIGHGHLSYIAVETKYPIETNLLLQKIATSLDNTMFVWRDNVQYIDNKLNVIYDSCSRGVFKVEVDPEYEMSHVRYLRTETTIEHLVDYLYDLWYDELVKVGVTYLYMSEGSNKGSVRMIKIAQ